MSAPGQHELLTRLITAAELALQMRCDAGSAERQADLLEQVRVAYQKPVDDVRVIDMDAMIFATALGAATEHLMSPRRENAAKYLRVLGVLLPEMRAALEVAMEQRKRVLS